MTKPISPAEALANKEKPIQVYEAFNKLIKNNLNPNTKTATVRQNEAVLAIEALTGMSRSYIFEQGWLNVEAAFAEVGWHVTYHKPSRGDTFEPYFIFEC